MNPSLLSKLNTLIERHEEISALLSDPEIINDQNKFRSLSKEYSELEPIVVTYKLYQQALQDLESAKEMQLDSDPDMQLLAKEELLSASEMVATHTNDLSILLLPKDPNDECNVFLEVRAGTGGNEAAIFAGDLFRMYARYAETQNWQIEVINESEGEQGGYKEIIARIIGMGAYSQLKFESGAHRVQRVPVTESQGRIHTSACTVAVMPEVAAVESIDIDPGELRIDTYRASGAGGQHVNRTDSAVRITHLPTGVVVECQDERSQHKNKAKAMSLLTAKLLSAQQQEQQQQQAEQRRNLVGSGDRSERIRTYNFPQGRITDHRINLTLYKLPEIIAGDLSPIINSLMHEHQADLLASMAE